MRITRISAAIAAFTMSLVGLALTGPASAEQRPTTTYAEQTRNNTSTCVEGSDTSPENCAGSYPGQVDTVTPDVETPMFNAPGGNVSHESTRRLLYPGSTTKIFVHVMLGFCTPADGSSSPTVPRCNSNVLTNYSSNDITTARAQLHDIARRGLDGVVMDWYAGGSPVDQASLKVQTAIHELGYCAKPRNCRISYLLNYDGSTLKWPVRPTGIPGTTGEACPPNEDATALEGCIVARIKNDLCYMNGYHFVDDAYQRYALEGDGPRPIVTFFVDEGHMFSNLPPTGPAPSWSDIWRQVRGWSSNLAESCGIAPYDDDNGAPLLIFQNAPGFTHVASDGAFNWVNPTQNQNDLRISPETVGGTVDHFYATSLPYSEDKLVFGIAYKGFNDTQSAWGERRVIDQRCGQTWLASLASVGKYYSRQNQLPFLQVATWNDHNEGTSIETGISNCYTVDARVDGRTLRWDLRASSPYATKATIARLQVFDSTDGTNYRLLAPLPRSRSFLQLDGLKPGTHRLFVKMVGESGFLNQASPIVSYVSR
ncbi:hypothetical protein [Actinopolymorpha alba]|uniref:hypothetical protein n=1 Tax=Actinopolymorpha alba TaxID=533267 RepID=UPI00035FB5CA|nr:hypothetical protein [Actinopolymorpha alba]